MITKSIKKSLAVKPLVRFFMAEDLRQEFSGKVSAIGLFSDNVVVVPLPADVPEPTKDAPIVVKSLALMFTVSKMYQDYELSVDVEQEGERTPFFAPRPFPPLEIGRSSNIIVRLEPCVITRFGLRQFIVKINDYEQRFDYEFRRQEVEPGVLAESSAAPAVKPVDGQRRVSGRKIKKAD